MAKEFRYGGVPIDGAVIKRLDAKYKEEKWIKVKPDDHVDMEVTGALPGRPGKHFGSLRSLVVRDPGTGKMVKVGIGFSDSERRWIWEHREKIKGDYARVELHARPGQRWTGPRFDSWHPDKAEYANRMYAEVGVRGA
jgi:ATP-dependent DNA ligase